MRIAGIKKIGSLSVGSIKQKGLQVASHWQGMLRLELV